MSSEMDHPWSVGSSSWSNSPVPSSPTLCKYFVSGGCTKGEACPFTHDLTVSASSDADASRGFVITGQVVNMRGGAGRSMGNGRQHIMNPSATPFAPTAEAWGMPEHRFEVEEAGWGHHHMVGDDAASMHQYRYQQRDHPFSPTGMLSSSNGLMMSHGYSQQGEVGEQTAWGHPDHPFQWGQQQLHVDAAPYQAPQGGQLYGAWPVNEEMMQRRRMQAMRTPLKANIKPNGNGLKHHDDDVSPSRRRHRHRGGNSGTRQAPSSPSKHTDTVRSAEAHRRLRNRPE